MLSEHQLQPLHIEHGLTELKDDHGATWHAFLAKQVWSHKLTMFLAQTPDQLLPLPFPKEARAQLLWEANTWPCCPRDGRALIRAKKRTGVQRLGLGFSLDSWTEDVLIATPLSRVLLASSPTPCPPPRWEGCCLSCNPTQFEALFPLFSLFSLFPML